MPKGCDGLEWVPTKRQWRETLIKLSYLGYRYHKSLKEGDTVTDAFKRLFHYMWYFWAEKKQWSQPPLLKRGIIILLS